MRQFKNFLKALLICIGEMIFVFALTWYFAKTYNPHLWPEGLQFVVFLLFVFFLCCIPVEMSALGKTKQAVPDLAKQPVKKICLMHSYKEFSRMPAETYHPVHNPYYVITYVCTKCLKQTTTKFKKQII